MQSIEMTGKTVEEAIGSALSQLNLTREQVEIQILAEGSKGLFGLGAKPAQVRVTPIETPEQTLLKAFLSGLCEQMGVEVQVLVQETESGYNVQLAAKNSQAAEQGTWAESMGMLIGHRGETLDMLQYLTNLVVNKNTSQYRRVTLDIENYRKKRAETLERLAVRLAENCKKTGRRMVLEPMNPYERRILHSTLQDDPFVTTFSEGEEPNRRVIIVRK